MKNTRKYIRDLDEPIFKDKNGYAFENIVLNQVKASKHFPVPVLLIMEGKNAKHLFLILGLLWPFLSTFVFSKDLIQCLKKNKPSS